MNRPYNVRYVLGILLLAGFSISGHSQDTPEVQIKVGETHPIKSQFEDLPIVEPHLSVNPNNGQQLLAAAMVVTDIDRPYESSRLSSFVSEDGGITWKETAHDYWGYDPWTAISTDGKAVLTWLGTEKWFRHQFPIQFFTSLDGGKSWSNPQTVTSPHGHDGTKVVSHNDSFYFTTVEFQNDMSADVVLYRKTKDDPFSEIARIPGQGQRLNFCEPAVLSDSLVLIPSSNYRQKFWTTPFDPANGKMGDKQLVSINPGGGRGYMRLVSDSSPTSPFSGRVYFTRAAAGSQSGIWINYSSDEGLSWSKDIRVDQNESDKAMVAAIAINTHGWVGISWVDRTDTKNPQSNHLYFTLSRDGGNTFSDSIRITREGSSPNTSQNGLTAKRFPGGGHYMNIAAKPDGSFQLIWSDSRRGVFSLYTCNISVSN